MLFVHIFAPTPPGGGGQTEKYTPLEAEEHENGFYYMQYYTLAWDGI